MLILSFVFVASAEAGILKKAAAVTGVVAAKSAFDKYAKNKFFKNMGKMGEKDVYQQDVNPDLIIEETDKFNRLCY